MELQRGQRDRHGTGRVVVAPSLSLTSLPANQPSLQPPAPQKQGCSLSPVLHWGWGTATVGKQQPEPWERLQGGKGAERRSAPRAAGPRAKTSPSLG